MNAANYTVRGLKTEPRGFRSLRQRAPRQLRGQGEGSAWFEYDQRHDGRRPARLSLPPVTLLGPGQRKPRQRPRRRGFAQPHRVKARWRNMANWPHRKRRLPSLRLPMKSGLSITRWLLITRLGRREGEVGNYPGNHDRHHAIRNMSPSIPAGCSTMFAESSLRRMHPARWSGDNPVACPC